MLAKLADNPRVTVRRSGEPGEGPVVYWMQRAQRALDNPALDLAIRAANELRRPVAVFFGLHPRYPGANLRHYKFLLDGLEETIDSIRRRGAAFVLRSYPRHDLIRFCEEIEAGLVIGDENPLRLPESWRRSAATKLRVPFWTVDADVVVPTRCFEKEEYAARTLRPKIRPLIDVFMNSEPPPDAICRWDLAPQSDAFEPVLLSGLPFDRSVSPVSGFIGGTGEAMKHLARFITTRLSRYHIDRNRPEIDGTSELSAYLHFGHIGPVTIARAVRSAGAPIEARDAFLEELIVRRELAVNHVARNPRHDRLSGSPSWARSSLERHRGDPRPFLYTESEFELAETHDPLWNAAQLEMVSTGRMHGFMRMYWAKKILEWSESPEEAHDVAIRLNDRYELDGRDPNGYTGIAWSMGGKHDRPWARRAVFGTIRYMSAAGMARKFDVDSYIRRVDSLVRGEA